VTTRSSHIPRSQELKKGVQRTGGDTHWTICTLQAQKGEKKREDDGNIYTTQHTKAAKPAIGMTE
jgi:hypothetical protein